MNRIWMGILAFFVFVCPVFATDRGAALVRFSELEGKNASIVAQADAIAADSQMDADAKIAALERLETESVRVSEEMGFWKKRANELSNRPHSESPARTEAVPMAPPGARTAGWGSSLLSLAFGGIVLIAIVGAGGFAGISLAERGGIVSAETADILRKRVRGYVLNVRSIFETEPTVPTVLRGTGSVAESPRIGQPISSGRIRSIIRRRPNGTPLDGEVPETLR